MIDLAKLAADNYRITKDRGYPVDDIFRDLQHCAGEVPYFDDRL